MFHTGDPSVRCNFITIGYDCSPASALRGLNLRRAALPFDWVESSVPAIDKCFADDFRQFHTNLQLNEPRRRLIDPYGFQFPHDYPLKNKQSEDVILPEDVIADDWATHYDVIKEKYDRRIARFREAMADPAPIIVLCRYKTQNVLTLQQLFIKYYNRDNLYFVNACADKFETGTIINIDTESSGNWSDGNIWKQGIIRMMGNLKRNRHRFSMRQLLL